MPERGSPNAASSPSGSKLFSSVRNGSMYIRLAEGTVADSDEVREGVVLDYDADGKVLGIELLNVSKRADNPREIAYEMLTG